MSEQAQGETKWRLGELARVRVHHGHASAVRLGCGANKKMAHDQLARLGDLRRRRAEDPQPEARVDDFVQRKGQVFFLWLSLCQSTGKKLGLLGQWTLKKRLALCDVRTNTVAPVLCLRLYWEHRDVAALPGSCPAMGYMHFSCSHLCHLSPPVFLVLSTTEASCSNGGRDTF